ncbi:hypothetical protein Egran_06139 [Elaphomyces granulatus]|uniref:DUF6604 domain-containing protein n=1 Tax=Elaphomyces granulatus TaxID=519963 RepID=A0A232LPL3_9EURO|nr:hypothetical protein Egran_06139 [Elaphomyces granulatus]
MADQNTYLRYKRDQKLLVYWITHTSNSIIKSFPSDAPMAVNTTGEVRLSTLVSLSGLIAGHIKPIPATIYRLFQSIIAARKETHTLFQQIVTSCPDPDVEKSNISHKHWIDGLTEAFKALGGDLWTTEQKSEKDRADEEDEEEVIFANKFSALSLSGEAKGEGEEDEAEGETDEAPVAAASIRSKQKSTNKKKKGKRGKKSKGRGKQTVDEPKLDQVPLESYRIIEDETGLVTDYLMAVYSLVTQWVELRHYLQGVWHHVAYDGLNSAVAGATSNIAVGMINNTESRIFVDFPGHDSFETVMKTITRGDPDKAQGMFHMSLQRVEPRSRVAKTVQCVDVDVKEQFLIHTYRDLLDFLTDFQKTRSGKPTKPLLSEIQNWDPTLNLQRATKESRIKWRRAYTINWLYDLVNVFSSIVVQRRSLKGQKITLESVDWSVSGPWNEHRRLFGLNEFAGDITGLAMQKPGTDVRPKILPHHVFQLQCIVDSLTVSRGWSLNSLKGHVLIPPARSFRPRRDVDLFLDRNNERPCHGFCYGVDILVQCFEKDAMMHGDPNRHKEVSAILKELRDDFVDWLGETKYMHGLKTIPPSRFSATNTNGLWEYSPFLCGVGLMEALELGYGMGFLIWDGIPEPMCLIHLHNMLVQKGYITQPVGMYATLQELFKTTFFANGHVPTSDFSQAFLAVINETGSRRATFHRRAIRRHVGRTATDIHGLLNSSINRFFTSKSLLRLYREADWVPDRIPDEEIPVESALALLRLSQTKHVTDPVTGKKVMENTELVKRARSIGIDDAMMMKMSSITQKSSIDRGITESVLAALPEGYKSARLPEYNRDGNNPSKGILSSRELLDLIKLDITSDVSSETRPLSSLNFIWVTARFMLLFLQIEDKMRQLRNPLWVEAYEGNSVLTREKRASFTSLVLAEEDEECLTVMAEEFQRPRAGFMNHIYWDDLETSESIRATTADEDAGPSCRVM